MKSVDSFRQQCPGSLGLLYIYIYIYMAILPQPTFCYLTVISSLNDRSHKSILNINWL